MTFKESEAFWTFVGQMRGFALVVEQMGKCLDSKILKDMSIDMTIKINDVQLKIKEATKDE